MNYKKLFSPNLVESFPDVSLRAARRGDMTDGSVYVYNEQIILAVNVALATGRPLLVRGPSGSGKSSLAKSIARVLRYRYYEKTISSRTQARDLLWEVDLLRRLQDAQAERLSDDFTPYIRPGVLWWAFNQESARQRGKALSDQIPELLLQEPPQEFNSKDAVVLLDEIDKADPDVPNNLLVPLGSMTFEVEEIGARVEAVMPPLVVLTTNDERSLSKAFLRRCVELNIKAANREDLIRIGKAHFGNAHVLTLEKVADLTMALCGDRSGEVGNPSPAEYLDAVRACIELRIEPGSAEWDDLSKVTLWKHGRSPTEKP